MRRARITCRLGRAAPRGERTLCVAKPNTSRTKRVAPVFQIEKFFALALGFGRDMLRLSHKRIAALYPTYGVLALRYRRVRIEGASYFFTVVTYKRLPILKSDEAVLAFMTALRAVQAAHPFELDAYVILPDHLHMIWTLPEGDSNYPMRWRQIKSTFTRTQESSETASKSRKSKSEQTIWQRRYWEHTITSETDFAAHVEYIHCNPVKHGYVAAPRDWPHSSFRKSVERGFYDINWASDNYELGGFVVPE